MHGECTENAQMKKKKMKMKMNVEKMKNFREFCGLICEK